MTMTKIRFLKNGFLWLALALTTSSCLKDEVELTGYGDAYIIVEIAGQDTLKGLGLHAYSYSDFSEVTVTPPEGTMTRYTLAPYLGYKQDFILETPLSQFTKNLPTAGVYLFSAKYADGQLLDFANELYTDYIFPPQIKTAAFSQASQRFDVTWSNVVYAHSYNVKLINAEGKTIFLSPELNNSVTEFSFTQSSQGWQSSEFPAQGAVLTIEVAAYHKEKNTPGNKLQCIARSRKGLTR